MTVPSGYVEVGRPLVTVVEELGRLAPPEQAAPPELAVPVQEQVDDVEVEDPPWAGSSELHEVSPLQQLGFSVDALSPLVETVVDVVHGDC